MKAIWKRELQGYFCTAAGYVYLFVFLTVSSVLFYLEILSQRSGELPTFIGEMSYLWMLLSPVLTMRLLAEEKQKKTDQLLLTSPVSLPRIVLGKYLAAVTVLLLATGLTLFYVGIVAVYGQVYPAELAVNYLGFVLQGCAFVALDLFLSGCAETPVTAAVLAFGANFLLWILDLLENAIHAEWISSALRFCSLYTRNEPFLMGQFSFAGLLFDLSVIALFLCLTVFRMERKRTGGLLRLRLRRKPGEGRIKRDPAGWPAILMILLAASIAALNIGAERLEKRYGWRRDFSFNSISTHSEVTRDTLEHLEHPVHLYALFRRGDEDALLTEVLDRYDAASELVTWEQLDPSTYTEERFDAGIQSARAVLETVVSDIEELLQKRQAKYWIPPVAQENETELLARFSFKTAAAHAGIGWFGKNDVIITKRYGPRVRLSAILIDEVFEYGRAFTKSECPDTCTKCIDICPCKALKNQLWTLYMDRSELIDYHKCNRMRSAFIKKLGRKNACGLCLAVCPVGRTDADELRTVKSCQVFLKKL